MAKRLKLRICRAIATTLQSCRSTDPSILPQNPVPSFSTLRFSLPPDHKPLRSAAAFISAGPATGSLPPLKFKWQKEEKWHVVDAETAHHHHHQPNKPRLKIYNSAADDLALTPPSPPLASSSAERNSSRRRKKKKKNIPSRLRLSTSSADSGWFSSEGGGAAAAAAAGGQMDEEETETLVSSSESSSFNPHRRSKRRGAVSKTRTKRAAAAEGETAARLSVFKKLIPCTVEGKVKESFAVVKRSDEPYEDFKESMMEMIVEKQMFEEKELEQLLQCFLSLNSRHYHGIIVQAFSEIWEVIFSPAVAAPQLSGHHLRRVS
ncbi:hypothetical protein MIMGU_mgv1a025822mg [Erythranthe guttata]|uniref:Transcription repressor n=1 Tax=Erythranthe guttata TaxID=4155 RepID=A0A022Q2V0_ERYGU|nr:PREDICTED: transcription repressor OFP7-like [Erythranthe guttata]EYU22326.1 hypothetical protein MIMGU_mgv1a025822mg [Erythranthe guttata]|eukprot:XP_012855509.1 PREDICTED: transcription repressor OFP7-like [Erythranthe guttata]